MRWWLAALVLVLGTAALADVPTTGVQNGGGVLLLLRTGTVTATPTPAPSGTVTGTAADTGTPTRTATPTLTPTFPFDWAIFVPSSGETIAADVQGDTATFTCQAPLFCAGTASTDTIVFGIFTYTPTSTFTATPTFTVTPTFTNTPTWTATATGTVTNTATNTPTATATPTQRTYWSLFAPSSGSNVTANVVADTATFTCTSPIVCTGDGSHTVTWSWNFTTNNTWTGTQTITTSTTTNAAPLTITVTDTGTGIAQNTTGLVVKADGGANATVPVLLGLSATGDLSSNTNGFIVTGLLGRGVKSGSGTLLALQGGSFIVQQGAASGLITLAVGVNIASAADAGGHITTLYGLFIQPQTVAIGQNWQLYSSGTAPSAFAGPMMFGGVTVPTNALDIDGQANQIVDVIRNVTAATAGKSLTVQGGGAKSAGTNLAGGALVLSGGISTGSGLGKVQVKTFPGIAASTTDNTAIIGYQVDASHLEAGGTAPGAPTSCGSGPTTASGSTDPAGTFTTGTGVFTACTITFAYTWSKAPKCFINTDGAAVTARVSSTTTTTMVVTTAATSAVIDWFCIGVQ